MGLIHQSIRLSNPHQPEIEEIDALALVDSGALELCIPEHIANQLKLKHAGQRIIHLADGRKEPKDVMTTVSVEVFGLSWNGQAIVTGDEVLLGAIPMESMNLLVDPAKQIVYPNPANPNIPVAAAKGARS
jgi:clan AA aspartic protease